MSSSIPFERYDEEFLSLTEQVTSKLRPLDPSTASSTSLPPTAEADVKMAHNLLLQADDLLKQMGLEARGVDDAAVKRDLLAKVRVCKTRLANLRDDYESAKNHIDRSSLGLNEDIELGGRNGSNNSGGGRNRTNGSKERLLSNTDTLQSQSDTLANARSVMAETEGVALEITEELGRHRETISSAHGRVRQVTGMTNRARRIVQSMSRREVQQKLILYGVAGTIVLVFLMLIYGMFKA
uniref:Vesicle transport v-SNARE N-terminal domain-containing protein n=1 Tax=Skeletonema marinoi TaxID=267567 RepID=A0A6U3TNS8_9STRA|mmetsp:Transcript_15969/g.26976  ORF Transcript_15969/g.26976 Transcript_15969/m.26976 type:complete len:239 (+) Transcript_15969:39-755(+)